MPKEIKENWEKEINEILITLTDKTGFNHSNESIDAFNLAEAGLVELLKSEKEKWEKEQIMAIDKRILEGIKKEQGTDEFYETIVKPIERRVKEKLLERIEEKINYELMGTEGFSNFARKKLLAIKIEIEKLKEEIKDEK